MFSSLPGALQLLLTPILLLWNQPQDNLIDNPSFKSFQLRHLHAVSNDSRILLSDVPPSFTSTEHVINSRHIKAYQPSSLFAFENARARAAQSLETPVDLWTSVNIPSPDTEDRATLLELAKMSNNAYFSPGDKSWYTLDPSAGNNTFPFGWEPDADGFRGHVFVSDDNSTVVLAIKGTSAGWLAGDNGPTVKKDKLNDNLLFSCCCARVGPTWSTVCGCYSGSRKCDIDCVQKSLADESLFYNVAINLYKNVTYLYPEATIWLTGHSLGGSLAALLGATFGVPVVAFEAPGDKLPSSRLHLPQPPSLLHITHVYHTADPIPNGVCTGVTSVCAIGGYALESKCHQGRVIKYDTVSKWGWTVDVRLHSIRTIVEKLLSVDWEPPIEGAMGRQVPEAGDESDCVDCYDWEFGQFQKSIADL